MPDKTTFTIAIDGDVVELLMELAVETGQPPKKLLESIVHDVLIDDACAHGCELPPRDPRYLN